MIFRNVFTFILILLELAWFVVYFQLKIVLLHCNRIPTQGDGIQWIKGVGFSFKLLACLWKCVCLHVKWLNKYIKLIMGGEPWWFQTPTSQPILSPSLVARPISSSDLWQVLHRYLLHPPGGAWPAFDTPGNIHYSNNFFLLDSFSFGKAVCWSRWLK